MERSEQKIKTYEGFLDRFKGEYGFRVGKKPKKEYGAKFLELLKVPVSDIQSLLLEITDEIKVDARSQNIYAINDQEEDFKFEYRLKFPGYNIDNGNLTGVIHFCIKNDKFLPMSIPTSDPNKLAEIIDMSEGIFSDHRLEFEIEFKTKDIYEDKFTSSSQFIGQKYWNKIKNANFNYTPLDKLKINIIKECGERICDMIEFEKFELDIKKPETNNGHTLAKLIFKI